MKIDVPVFNHLTVTTGYKSNIVNSGYEGSFEAFTLKMEAARSSEMLISYHNTTRHHDPQSPPLEKYWYKLNV
jgi:hypothetical protein